MSKQYILQLRCSLYPVRHFLSRFKTTKGFIKDITASYFFSYFEQIQNHNLNDRLDTDIKFGFFKRPLYCIFLLISIILIPYY